MPTVFYVLEKRMVEAESAETLLQVALRAGIPLAHACGGNARCSTCRVVILEGLDHCAARNDKEQKLADRLHFTKDIRLACQTTISNDVKLRRLVLDEADLQLTDQRSTEGVPTSAGEERRLAVLFSDIRGFTPFAEALPPYDVVHVLNRYFHDMGIVIDRNGCRVERIRVTAVTRANRRAVFGLVQSDPDDTRCDRRQAGSRVDTFAPRHEESSTLNPASALEQS